MSADINPEQSKVVERIFAEFNESWMNYWAAYVELQNSLYESVKAARDVSWLAATDVDKISRINQLQRDLFSSMPRRMDYLPLGQIARNMDTAVSKLDELEKALSSEKVRCGRLEDAIEVLSGQVKRAKQELGVLVSSRG